MSTPQALAAETKRHGWRSGSAAPEALLPTVAAALETVGRGELVPRLHDGNARAFVVSHTCDLMVEDFEAEPSVEWIVADRRETVDRGNDRIQSTRMLDVAAADGVPFRFHTRNRLFTRRDVLAMHAPHASGSIDIDTAVRLVQRWLSRRYARQPYPDAFVERLALRADDKLRRLLKQLTGELRTIRLRIDPLHDELPSTQSYSMEVICIVTGRLPASTTVQGRIDRLEALLRAKPGISVRTVQTLDGPAASYEDVLTTSELLLDDLTLSGRPGEPSGAEPALHDPAEP